MKKENSKKLKGYLYGLGVCMLPISLTGCNSEPSMKSIVNSSKVTNVGILKEGDVITPYVKIEDSYYNICTEEIIGISGDIQIDKWEFETCENESEKYILYFQAMPFIHCNPHTQYTYKKIMNFTEENYKDLENNYFASHTFTTRYIGIYEVINPTTNERKYIIGKRVSETEIFNFEAFMVEDYTGYTITNKNIKFEKTEYYYPEILELIENYRAQNQEYTRKRN